MTSRTASAAERRGNKVPVAGSARRVVPSPSTTTQRGPAALEATRAVLLAHRARVEEKIAEWKRAKALVDAKIAFYTRWIEEGERPKAH